MPDRRTLLFPKAEKPIEIFEMAKSKYQSPIAEAVHETMADIHAVGGIDKKTLSDKLR